MVGLVLAGAYVILLSGAVVNSRENVLRRWLALYLLSSTLLSGLLAIYGPDQALGRTLDLSVVPPVAGQASALAIMLFYLFNSALLGVLTFQYQRLPYDRGWLVLGVVASLAVLGVAGLEPGDALSAGSWRDAVLASPPGYAAILAAGVYLLAGLAQEVFTVVTLQGAVLPLRANRSLFWGLALPVIVTGEVMAAWGEGVAALVGQGVRWVGVAGLTYAITTRHLVDVRGQVRRGVGDLIFLSLVTLFILLAVSLSQLILTMVPGIRGLLAVAGLALLMGLLYERVRRLMSQVIRQIILNIGYDPAAIARSFSERVATSLDTLEITRAASDVFKQALNARRSMLLMLDQPVDGKVVARPFWPEGGATVRRITFAADSPVLVMLRRHHSPVLQYDIDEDPLYEALGEGERRWLRSLHMDVYVPVRERDQLHGVFAVGPRASGDPYRPQELELMATVADQSSVALKNARLFGDLRRLNEEMRRLNEDLRETNEALAEMDRVKTDFITIASHELRTPLTQLRGYADVLGTMVDQNALNPEMVTTIVESIKRASDRLDTVYGQMLDVSQIDVNAMDLKLVDTTLDAVLRLAVEPYASAMRERRQTLTVQGVKKLPPIRGDFQRLVQAFGHLVGNAVKFTPDGGRIDIGARTVSSESGQPHSIEVVVADRGVGIDPQYHDLIFKKFFRIGSTALHSTSTSKFMGAGPGLGLPIAKGVIDGHGGKIWVESAGNYPERLPGTRVHVLLPLSPPAFLPGATRSKASEPAESKIRPFA